MAESGFDRDRFQARLGTRRLGHTLIALDTVDSTNDAAWTTWATQPADGVVIVADAQTRGRGRAGRAWHTSPGLGLALSMLLLDDLARETLAAMPLAAGLALARALEQLGARAELKWPNDVLLSGRKVAGVLCESRATSNRLAIVIGVGVNVAQTVEDFPPELRDVATSLAIENLVATREGVAAEFLGAFEPLRDDLAARGTASVLDAWRSRASFWNRRVRVRTPVGPIEGVARDLDECGALILRRDDGHDVTVLAGDLELESGAPG